MAAAGSAVPSFYGLAGSVGVFLSVWAATARFAHCHCGRPAAVR